MTSIGRVARATDLLALKGAIALWFLAPLSPLARLAAQGTVKRLPEAALCSDCIRLTRVLTLGGASRIGSPPVIVRRDKRGLAYVIEENASVPPLVFSPAGKFERHLGKIGREAGNSIGPGVIEFTTGDSVVIADIGQKRLNVWGPDGRFHRSVELEVTAGPGFQIASGDFVFVDYIASPEVAGFPVHVVSATTGKVTRSFGTPRAIVPGVWRPRYIGIEGRAGEIWLAERTAYKIQRWSTKGALLGEFEARREWYPESKVRSPLSPNKPPPSQARALYVDRVRNHLWILISVLNPAWRQGIRLEQGAHGQSYRVFDWNKVYDTRIEVIDLTSSRVLASALVPEMVAYVTRDGEVGSLRGRAGNVMVDIWTIQLDSTKTPVSNR